MNKVPEDYSTALAEHTKQRQEAEAFVARYGEDFTVAANEFSRGMILITLRLMQAYHHDDRWVKDGILESYQRKELSFREFKVFRYQQLMEQMASLCRAHRVEPAFAPRDFIRNSHLGPGATEDEMEGFWDDLWNRLPEKWQTRDFPWHWIIFSGKELPFFVWMVRPAPLPSEKGFTAHMTKEERVAYLKKFKEIFKEQHA